MVSLIVTFFCCSLLAHKISCDEDISPELDIESNSSKNKTSANNDDSTSPASVELIDTSFTNIQSIYSNTSELAPVTENPINRRSVKEGNILESYYKILGRTTLRSYDKLIKDHSLNDGIERNSPIGTISPETTAIKNDTILDRISVYVDYNDQNFNKSMSNYTKLGNISTPDNPNAEQSTEISSSTDIKSTNFVDLNRERKIEILGTHSSNSYEDDTTPTNSVLNSSQTYKEQISTITELNLNANNETVTKSEEESAKNHIDHYVPAETQVDINRELKTMYGNDVANENYKKLIGYIAVDEGDYKKLLQNGTIIVDPSMFSRARSPYDKSGIYSQNNVLQAPYFMGSINGYYKPEPIKKSSVGPISYIYHTTSRSPPECGARNCTKNDETNELTIHKSRKISNSTKVDNKIELAYQVSLKIPHKKNRTRFCGFCGGAIIGEYKVLSAAHCFQMKKRTFFEWELENLDFFLKIIRVVAGEVDESMIEPRCRDDPEDNNTGQWRSVSRVNIQEYYHSHQDIAVVELSEPWIFNDFVQPIQIPSVRRDYCGECVISGFGRRSYRDEEVKHSVLHKATVRLQSADECEEATAPMLLNEHNNSDGGGSRGPLRILCVADYLYDTSVVDTGGPLVCFNTGDPGDTKHGTLVGIMVGQVNERTLFHRVFDSGHTTVDAAKHSSAYRLTVKIAIISLISLYVSI